MVCTGEGVKYYFSQNTPDFYRDSPILKTT